MAVSHPEQWIYLDMAIPKRRQLYNPTETLDRIGARIDTVGSFEAIDEMIEKHGMVQGRPFSFEGHEYQREIARDTSRRIYVRKCSQVGLSEIIAQKVVAMCAILQHENVILTQPDLSMARRFSAGRIDPILESSIQYSNMLSKSVNSTTQKKIGSSFLYISGAGSDAGAISVPALVVISDEVDFSNQLILGKLSSRLSHNELNDEGEQGFRFEFSTPTTENWGIDQKYNSGSKNQYMVKCIHCKKWVCVDFFTDFDIPGMDKPLKELLIGDSTNSKYRMNETVIRCSCCRGDLYTSLMDPARRQWVSLSPGNRIKSYQVNPWDVPKYNTPTAIMRRLGEYSREEDYFNFALGLPMSTMDNAFNVSMVHLQAKGVNAPWDITGPPPEGHVVMGMDVGKTCHLSVGQVDDNGRLKVILQEKIHNKNGGLAEQVKERFDYFNPTKFLLDAAPETEMASQLVTYGEGRIQATEYATSRLEGLKLYIAKEKDALKGFFRFVRVDRTKILSKLMREHNMGNITYPSDAVREVFSHLEVIRKVRNPNATTADDVERVESSTRNDHWGHSLGYTLLAAEIHLEEERLRPEPKYSMPPSVAKIRFGAEANKERNLFGEMY